MHITVYVSENIWLVLYILWYFTSIPPPSLLLHSMTSLSCCGGHVGLNPAYIYFAQGTYMKLPSLVQSVRVTLVDRREVFSFANKIRISIGTAITEKEGWVEHLAKLKETELIVTSNSSRLPPWGSWFLVWLLLNRHSAICPQNWFYFFIVCNALFNYFIILQPYIKDIYIKMKYIQLNHYFRFLQTLCSSIACILKTNLCVGHESACIFTDLVVSCASVCCGFASNPGVQIL